MREERSSSFSPIFVALLSFLFLSFACFPSRRSPSGQRRWMIQLREENRNWWTWSLFIDRWASNRSFDAVAVAAASEKDILIKSSLRGLMGFWWALRTTREAKRDVLIMMKVCGRRERGTIKGKNECLSLSFFHSPSLSKNDFYK